MNHASNVLEQITTILAGKIQSNSEQVLLTNVMANISFRVAIWKHFGCSSFFSTDLYDVFSFASDLSCDRRVEERCGGFKGNPAEVWHIALAFGVDV